MAPRKKSSSSRKTSKSASKDVESAMRRRKKGTLESGSGKKVTSKKQAIAIGLSEARKGARRSPGRNPDGCGARLPNSK